MPTAAPFSLREKRLFRLRCPFQEVGQDPLPLQVRLQGPRPRNKKQTEPRNECDRVCGIFFNEARNEYNHLSLCPPPPPPDDMSRRFYVYGLRSRRTDAEVASSPFLFRTCSRQSAVVANRAVFLMAERIHQPGINHCMNAILVFEMDSGKFHSRPHPRFGFSHGTCLHFSPYSYLFVHDGRLRFCLSDRDRGLLYMWTLVDYAKWLWVRMGSTISLLNPGRPTYGDCFAIYSVRKDELLVYWVPSLFLVNLKEASVEEIDVPHKWRYSLSFLAYRSMLAAPHLRGDKGVFCL